MIEVFAERAFRNLFRQVLVGGGHHAHVNRNILVAADAGEFFLLQDAQHLGLGGQAHIADLVEEERTAVSLLEFALVLLDGRGKGSLLMAEEFTLDKLARDGGAVDFDERSGGTGTLVVQAAGNQFLSGSVGTHDQDTRIGGSDAVHDFLDMFDSGRSAHDLVFALDLLLQADGLLDQRGLVGGILERDQDTVQVERLLDEIISAHLDAFDGRVDVAVAGNHDDRRFAVGFNQRVKYFVAIHHGHFDIAENGIIGVGKGFFDALLAVLGSGYLMAFEFQNILERVADAPFVIDDQDLHDSCDLSGIDCKDRHYFLFLWKRIRQLWSLSSSPSTAIPPPERGPSPSKSPAGWASCIWTAVPCTGPSPCTPCRTGRSSGTERSSTANFRKTSFWARSTSRSCRKRTVRCAFS